MGLKHFSVERLPGETVDVDGAGSTDAGTTKISFLFGKDDCTFMIAFLIC
jgi:hypothetical protein